MEEIWSLTLTSSTCPSLSKLFTSLASDSLIFLNGFTRPASFIMILSLITFWLPTTKTEKKPCIKYNWSILGLLHPMLIKMAITYPNVKWTFFVLTWFSPLRTSSNVLLLAEETIWCPWFICSCFCLTRVACRLWVQPIWLKNKFTNM